jgi:hypothetical protein
MRVVIQTLLCLALTITLIGCSSNKVVAPDKDKLKTVETKDASSGAAKTFEIK